MMTMRAVVTERRGDYDVMRLRDVPVSALGDREVLMRTAASGVCYHDHLIRAGVMRRGITFPLILGYENPRLFIDRHPLYQSAAGEVRPRAKVAVTGRNRWTTSTAGATSPRRRTSRRTS